MRPWLEINLDAVLANARALARRAAPAHLCAVVKTNAYGHGLVPVGRALASANISDLRLGVFTPAEGLALRHAGVVAPIVVLGPTSDADTQSAHDASLECAILSADDAARYHPGTAVHVKVDTGVARFGVHPSEAEGAIAACLERGLRVAGVYSHLANAEDLDESLTLAQLRRLLSIPRPDGAIAHIAASAAAILWPQTRLDMVRCGIALYGHWPSAPVASVAAANGFALTRALRWFAPVVLTRRVAQGDTVGYGCDFVAQRDATIAVLPLGYGDGLPRSAGDGNLQVRLHAARAPVVGRICMNACMIDVTDVPGQARRGDVVELDVDEVARAAGTINYEVLSRFPESLERRYV